MRITKFGHSCIRIEHDGHTLVVDPGGFTQPEAVDGADAVLVTHEHPDHYEPAHLARAGAPVFTIDAVATADPRGRTRRRRAAHRRGTGASPSRRPACRCERSASCTP